MFLVGFAVREMVMGIFSGSAPSPRFQHVRELPEFATLMSLDRRKWPWCLLWHGWLPGLGGTSTSDPWASSFGDLVFGYLERCLGAYPVDFAGWTPPEMSEHHNIWIDGSREDFSSVGGFEVAGAGVYLPATAIAFDSSIW